MRPLAVAGLILCGCAGPGRAQEQFDQQVEQGRLLAMSLCAQCHATGASDASPHPQAPAFRALDRRLDLDAFFQRLREGITAGHPDMPTVRFTREDAHAFMAYLRSVQR